MTAAVVDLGEKRLFNQCVQKLGELETQMLEFKFQSDDHVVQRTANTRMAELLLRYGPLLDHVREPLLEMIELALIFTGDDRDYVGALGIVLHDLRHQAKLPELLAARRASLPTEHSRMVRAGMGVLLEPPAPPKETPES